MANQRDVALSQNGKLLASSDANLPLYKVKASDHFCDWVLYLQTSIHFHEVKFVSVCVKDEFNCARVVVPYSLRSRDRCLTHLGSEGPRDARRCLLNDLLMSTLDRAITLIHVHIVAMLVTEDLNLDMARMFHVLLHDHVIVIEPLHRLSFGSIKLVHKLGLVANNTHPFATSTERCLEHDREADLTRLLEKELGRLIVPVVPLQDRHSSFLHNALALTFGAHLSDGAGWWTYKGQIFRLEQVNKVRVLGQETIANQGKIKAKS